MPFFHYGRKIIQQQQSGVPDPIIFYDINDTTSYSGLGSTTLTNIGTLGDISGTRGTLSGPAYVPITWPPSSGNSFAGLDFDGLNDKITFSQFDFGDEITITAWVYPRNEFSINTLMSNTFANQNTAGFKLGWNSWNTTNRRMWFEAGDGSSGLARTSANNTIVENEWQMISYVFDKTNATISFYKDGTLQSTNTLISNIPTNNSSWWIGSIGGNSYYMDAILSTFKIHNTLLTDTELSLEFDNTKSRHGL